MPCPKVPTSWDWHRAQHNHPSVSYPVISTSTHSLSVISSLPPYSAFSPGSLLYLAFLFFPIHIPPSIPTHSLSQLHPSLLSSLHPSSAPSFHLLFISLRLSIHSPVISLFPSILPLFLSLIIFNFVFLLCLFFILLYSSTSSKPCSSFPSFLSFPFVFSPFLLLLHLCVHPPYFHLTSLFIAPTSLSSPPLVLGYLPLPPFIFITLSILQQCPPPFLPFSDSHLAFFLIPILFPPSIPALYPLPFFPEVSVFSCFSFSPIFLPPWLT